MFGMVNRGGTNLDVTDARALLGAINNADIYGLVFKAHGLAFRRGATVFVSEEDPPPYHSNMLALHPDASVSQLEEVLALKRLRGTVGVKDGFRRLDLSAEGFDLLFEAAWVWAPAQSLRVSDGWERVRDAEALTAWEQAWQACGSPADRRVFPPSLLSEDHIAFLGLPSNDGYNAGCIVNWSEGCVGLSNVFSASADIEVHAAAAGAAAKLADGQPIVGYDRGAALKALIGCGFEKVGDLRVWVFDGASSP
jgi:hypothetical protein